METLMIIIQLLVCVALVILYSSTKRKLGSKEIEEEFLKGKIRSREVEIAGVEEKNYDLRNIINEQQTAFKEKELQIINQGGTINSLRSQIDALESREQAESEKPVHVRLFVDHYEDKRFKNSATINLHSIELRDEELIKEDYVKVIRSLAGKGYFSEEIQSNFGYNAKTGRVTFNLISSDNEGDPKAFASWKDFLIDRELFTKTVTEYIQQVIGQREINKAVDEALTRKEVASV